MLSKVTDYTILKEQAPDQLIVTVKRAMQDGWVPSGPLILDSREYLQAMVKFGG